MHNRIHPTPFFIIFGNDQDRLEGESFFWEVLGEKYGTMYNRAKQSGHAAHHLNNPYYWLTVNHYLKEWPCINFPYSKNT